MSYSLNRIFRTFFSIVFLLGISSGGTNDRCVGLAAPEACVLTLYDTNGHFQGVLNTWIETDLNITEDVNTLSICFNLQLLRTFQTSRKGSSGIFELSTGILLFLSDNYLVLASSSGRNLIKSRFPVKVHTWMNICAVIGDSLKLFVEGVEAPNSLTGLSQPFKAGIHKLSMGLNKKVNGGRNQKPSAMKFSTPLISTSEVTLIQVENLSKCILDDWPSSEKLEWHLMQLESTETDEIVMNNFTMDAADKIFNFGRSCLNLDDKNNTYDPVPWNEATCSSLEPRNANFKFEAVSIFDVCKEKTEEKIVILEGKFTYEEAERNCKLFKGEIISESIPHLISKVQELLDSSSLNITRSFLKRNKDSSTCYFLIDKNGVLSKVSVRCQSSSQLVNVICQVNYDHPFYFRLYTDRPLCELSFDLARTGSFDDTLFIARGNSSSFSLASITGARLERVGSRSFIFTNGMDFNMSLRDATTPIGKNSWTIVLPDSGKTVTEDFILTGCEKNEFTCFTGDCISITSRCNGKIDCLDGSDEECQILETNLEENSTLVRVPPRFLTPLNFTLQLVRIQEILEQEHVVKLRLMFITTWKDHRLNFSHLQPEFGDNEISSNVWKPTLTFSNVLFNDWRDYLSGKLGTDFLNVIKENDVEPSISMTGLEESMYNGETDASIIRTEEFVAGFICDFQLSLFPFDVHECQFNISIENKGSSLVYFNIDEVKLISEEMVLTRFIASKLYFDIEKFENLENPTTISFSVIFERRFASYLITSFFPCFLIGVLGFLTNAFETNNFSDRVLVCLSCLIVLSTLFAQLNSNLPDSSVPKAIAVFFCFYIIKLSYEYICHTVTRILRERNKISNNQRSDDGNEIFGTFPSIKPPRFSDSATNLILVFFGLGCELIFICIFVAYVIQSRNNVFNHVKLSL